MATEDEEIALLEELLLETDEEDEEKKKKEKKFFADSSDEEDQKESCSKYNEFGSGINKILKEADESRKFNAIRLTEGCNIQQPSTSRSFQSTASSAQKQPATSLNQSKSQPTTPKETVCSDPIFNLRIINPVISSVSLKERMAGKIPVGVQRARFHTEKGDLSKDWVIAGVITFKSPIKTSQKGDLFSIWNISDLQGEIKTCTVFLFNSAHHELWKTNVGTVIAILNPKVLERKDEKAQAVLSVDNNQKIMILGQSKDLGNCKSKKNNGDVCGAIVNKTDCDVCIFHMKKEYGQIKRSELQASGLGRGLNELRNKVLGKSEIFYAGNSFTAQKAQKPVKQMKKDRERLMNLSEYSTTAYNPNAPPRAPQSTPADESAPPGLIKRAATIDQSNAQRKKDIERLKLLQGTETPQIVLTPKFEKVNQPQPSVAPKDTNFVPKLTTGNLTFSFSMPGKGGKIQGKSNDLAKQRAAAILKKKPLETANPNLLKYRGTEAGKKRIADELTSTTEGQSSAKKVKISEEEYATKRKEYLQKMMNAKSSNEGLVENMQREKEQKTFDRLEKKEAMEERMAATTEVKVSFYLFS